MPQDPPDKQNDQKGRNGAPLRPGLQSFAVASTKTVVVSSWPALEGMIDRERKKNCGRELVHTQKKKKKNFPSHVCMHRLLRSVGCRKCPATRPCKRGQRGFETKGDIDSRG